MPEIETTRSTAAAVVSFRPASVAAHERLHRDAIAAGKSTSEYLRLLVAKGTDMRSHEQALLDALRATGATVWIDIRRGHGAKPPTARVRGADLSAIARVEVEPSGGRYALNFIGVGELAGARLILAALPARLSATLEIPLASLGENLLEALPI